VALKWQTRRHIEAEIVNYHDTLHQVNQLRDEIINGTQRDEAGPVTGGDIHTSKVERRATVLADHRLLIEMLRITDAIKRVYQKAKTDGHKILYVKYGLLIDWTPPQDLVDAMGDENRSDMTVDRMAEILHMDSSTIRRHRTGIIYGIAEQLGWW
jgi:RinA family phage transcriptional activator